MAAMSMGLTRNRTSMAEAASDIEQAMMFGCAAMKMPKVNMERAWPVSDNINTHLCNTVGIFMSYLHCIHALILNYKILIYDFGQ